VAKTYEPIASQTLGSAAASVTFSGIAATWTDLLISFGSLETNNGSGVRVDFNTDTGANYSVTHLWGSGSSLGSYRESDRFLDGIGNGEFAPGSLFINVFSYANTNVFKTVLSAAANEYGVSRSVLLWRSTSAVTSLTFQMGGSDNFKAGTTVSLYGIKAA
jgi:hypothetical protein